MPSKHRFTNPCYTLLENLQFFKSTEMPGIFISHSYKVIIIHRLYVRVFPCLELNPEESQHIQINTKTWSQVLPSHNTWTLPLNTENQAFLFLSIMFCGKYTWKRKAFKMCFSPSCICSSSCSGSLCVLPYYWTLSSLIREFSHLYLLLREPFSKTIVNAYREFTDSLHISELKQMRAKTAAKFRERNKYKPYVCQRISELVL